jgi:hypothetical protein
MKKNFVYIFFFVFLAITTISPVFSIKKYEIVNDTAIYSNIEASNGTWNASITIPVTLGEHHSVDIGDANNDGINEFAVPDFINNTLIYSWDNSSKSFSETKIEVGDCPYSVFIGDANNDGYNDIVSADYWNWSISIVLWNPISEDWDPRIEIPFDITPDQVFIEDVNNDGDNDVIAIRYGSDEILMLLWNDTTSMWDEQIKLVGNDIIDIYIGDTNNDGDNDIVTTNYGTTSSFISIFPWNDTLKDWGPQIKFDTTDDQPNSVVVADVNNDGFNDICVGNQFNNSISLFLRDESSEDWDEIIKPNVLEPTSIVIGDLNNDTLNDIIVTQYTSNIVSIYIWNDTNDNWNTQMNLNVGDRPYKVGVGDLNNDGLNDIVTVNSYPFHDDFISVRFYYIESESEDNGDKTPDNGDDEIIPGYNVFYLLVLLSFSAIFLIKRKFKKQNVG